MKKGDITVRRGETVFVRGRHRGEPGVITYLHGRNIQVVSISGAILSLPCSQIQTVPLCLKGRVEEILRSSPVTKIYLN